MNTANVPVGMISSSISLDNSEQVQAIIQAAKNIELEFSGTPVRLIIIDTLASTAGQLDENQARDMGIYVKALSWIRAATGATVLIIHHTGLREGDRGRGSSALRGAWDNELLVIGDASGGVIRPSKMREREVPQADCIYPGDPRSRDGRSRQNREISGMCISSGRQPERAKCGSVDWRDKGRA